MLLNFVAYFVLIRVLFETVVSVTLNSEEIIKYYSPSDCASDEYFNSNQLKCLTCDAKKNLIPSPDGLSCVCNNRSIIKKSGFGSIPVCQLCKKNEIPTHDQTNCIFCPKSSTNSSISCTNFQCTSDSILEERYHNGTLRLEAVCTKCIPGTIPSDALKQCIPCKRFVATGQPKCECDKGQLNVEGYCVSDIVENSSGEKNIYSIIYENGIKVDSKFFRDNLVRGVTLCKMGNQTACHLIANMCVMLLYKEEVKPGPCSIFTEKNRISTSETKTVPWIYYGEGEASTILSRKKISTQFNLYSESVMNHLNLTGIVYYPDGRLKGIQKIYEHTLQLCPSLWKLESSFRFASKYSKTCEIPVEQLLSKETEFFDIFLSYKEADEELLYAIPILILNIKNEGTVSNRVSDQMQWQLVRRFFLLDKVSGVQHVEGQNQSFIPKVIRYAKSIILKVRLVGNDNSGKIYVPYLEIEYAEFTEEEVMRGNLTKLHFKIDYEIENSFSHTLEVYMGVFSGLAVVWSGIQTWSHTKRSGRVAIDFVTVLHLLIFTCGNLANVFFFIIFCACLNFFVFFKGQSVIHVLLPRDNQETDMKIYIMFAFVLKLVEIGRLLYNQITIDVFFIDWERPRARNVVPRVGGQIETEEEQPISIWRTYFVANEWNEIQTKRKINVYIHLLITVFILKIIQLEHWASSSPELYLIKSHEHEDNDFSFTCFFAIGNLVFLSIYILQRVYVAFFHERYIKDGIQQFVDVCSMANISVFILALENYGFYIHGRSAHGFADTNMQNILSQLQREEEDLVGYRGLLPGSEQQTFEMTVPTQLRAYYRKALAPLKNMSKAVKRLAVNNSSERSKMKTETVDRSVEAYRNMNRFLAAFLEHALKDLDYEVREKLFTEYLLGIEFADSAEKGVFYSDNGHSFDSVLFYGNEFSLLTFDVLLFSFIIVLFEDFLIAGIVTACFTHLLVAIRNLGGRKNLAKKTLIDERFLI